MKTKILTIAKAMAFISIIFGAKVHAQTKQKLAVMVINSKGISIDSTQAEDLVRMEVEKSNRYYVINKYDLSDELKKNNTSLNGCQGNLCLFAAADVVKTDKIITGSIEKFGNEIIVNLRLLNVLDRTVEKTSLINFIYEPEMVNSMLSLSTKSLLNLPLDEALFSKLTNHNSLDNSINNAGKSSLKVNGTRLGILAVTGEYAEILKAPKKDGGFDAIPVMTMFGYQYETQYLNTGKIQGLVENVWSLNGLDQGRFIPAWAILNGLRNNVNGWEFALGPRFSMVRKASGYYVNDDEKTQWHHEDDWAKDSANYTHSSGYYGSYPTLKDNPNTEVKRVDSRGIPNFTSSFVFAVGKTFKSGNMNIPVNAYVTPGRDGWRIGISTGFNVAKK